jgi:hypothetical protein
VGVEKLFSRDFTNEIRSQVIESSFAAGAEIHTNYCFGSFFNSHRRLHSEPVIGIVRDLQLLSGQAWASWDVPVPEETVLSKAWQ